MNLNLDFSVAKQYKSKSQIARVVTEKWVERNMYCVNCGSGYLDHLKNNAHNKDFRCPNCSKKFELKSKVGPFGDKLNGAAYSSMEETLNSLDKPDFMFMVRSDDGKTVRDLFVVPGEYLNIDLVLKRTELSKAARRAGWCGSIILMDRIPKECRVYIVEDGKIIDKEVVLRRVKRAREEYYC